MKLLQRRRMTEQEKELLAFHGSLGVWPRAPLPPAAVRRCLSRQARAVLEALCLVARIAGTSESLDSLARFLRAFFCAGAASLGT
jgi:hypothetical protein